MIALIRPAVSLVVLFTLLLGLVYPLALTGFAKLVLPYQANGSLIENKGQMIGSAQIGQSFTSDRYLQGRPSVTAATDPKDATKTVDAPYNAASSGGSNLGPSSEILRKTIKERAAAIGTAPVPADAVTASASGLDPHISPAFAKLQVARIAKARNMDAAKVEAVIARHIEQKLVGLIGEPRVNVLLVNRALDSGE